MTNLNLITKIKNIQTKDSFLGENHMSQMPVKVSTRTVEGASVYEATVQIPEIRPTKLVRKADGSTRFPSRSAALTSARSLAKKLGYVDGVEDTGHTAKNRKTK